MMLNERELGGDGAPPHFKCPCHGTVIPSAFLMWPQRLSFSFYNNNVYTNCTFL